MVLPEYPFPVWARGPLRDGLAELYGRHAGDYDAAFVAARVQEIARTLRDGLFEPDDEPLRRAMAAGAFLVRPEGGLAFRRNDDGPVWRPDHVLRRGEGNCLGLSTVYLLVAEELGIEAHAVLQPRPLHVVVAVEDAFFDLTKRFRAIRGDEPALWSAVGSSRRFGSRLGAAEVLALHAATMATVRLRAVGDGRDVEDAIWELFEVACGLDGNSATAHMGLAARAALAGDGDTALAHIRRSVELNPLSVSALVALASFESEWGSEEAAQAAFRRAEQVEGRKLRLPGWQDAPPVSLPD